MEINNNDWFENLNYPSIDHQQQQTFVTKHDLGLLHKKIIATDLIVQKYQEVNKALSRLQIENDDLKQQIEQITNECCIFSKQVTECTQECDNLKEQIEISNSDKRELHEQIRLLQDENTNNNHEIMVLRQFESLKDTNDQLTKTVDRQQKTIGKLQLQLQRKSPIVYKPIKNKQEPSETDLALIKSEKSVRELRLALGRLVNFIQLSKIEIPTALHIRPVLKAHDITDDFLEIEGDIPRKPVKKILKPVISQTDDDDDDHGDFIDINHDIPVPLVHTVDVIEKTPLPSRQEEKKSKPTKKSRRKKENKSTKLDELANELEIALSQSDQPSTSFLNDDNNNKLSTSDRPQINSTITFSNNISFFSDDDDNEISSQKLPSRIEQLTSVNKRNTSSLQIDSIIPMEIETSNKRTNYMSFLSEDDDDDNNNKSVSMQEYIYPLDLNKSNFNENAYSSQLSDTPSSSSNQQIETISDNVPVSLLNTKDQTTTSVNILNSNHQKIVLRLLNILTQLPVPLKPLRLVRRRIQPKSTSEEQITTSTENKIDNEKTNSIITETLKQLEIIEEINKISKQIEVQPKHIEEIQISSSTEIIQISSSTEVFDNDEENNSIVDEIHEELQITADTNYINIKFSGVHKESQTLVEDNSIVATELHDVQQPVTELHDVQQPVTELHDVQESVTELHKVQQPITELYEVQQPVIEENHDVEDTSTITNEVHEVQQPVIEENHDVEDTSTIINEVHEVQQPVIEENDDAEDNSTIVNEEQQPVVEKNDETEQKNIVVSEVYEELQTTVEKSSLNEQSVVVKESSVIIIPQEPTFTVEKIQFKQPLPPSLVLESSQKSLLKPFQISIITRLLKTLTNLPVKPLSFPILSPRQKRKRQSVIKKSSVTISRQSSTRSSRSPTRMQTRSLNSIRTCLARCNQPTTIPKKRTNTESTSPSSKPNIKRMKSTKIEQNNTEYDLINKFLNSSSKTINNELKALLEKKLHEDISLFIDHLYRILNEFMMKKCDIKHPLIEQFYSYELSIKILLTFIHNQSTIFQKDFIKKLNQTFEDDLKQQQQQKTDDQIKISNRLFILTCSTCTPSSSTSVIIYTRLFDIGYSLSHNILQDALLYVNNKCSVLISVQNRSNSSNILLHKILFELLETKQQEISYEYIEDLLITYQKYTHDQQDLIRSFILIFRHQTWIWCSNEFCLKILFPLLENIHDQYQRLTFFIILQSLLSIYKDNDDFKQDTNFHIQLKQRLQTLKTLNHDECTVRDNICSILP